MAKQKISSGTKGAFAVGTTATIGAYASMLLLKNYSIPPEVSAPVVGIGLAWLGKWAGKLQP